MPQTGAEFIADNWGWFLCVFGIVGGLSGGLISDKLFQSRRGPPTAFLCGLILLLAIFMAAFLFSPQTVGWSAVLVVMASIGITSLMSGTAATDFGGRKATATCSGIVDGFAYLGSGLQCLCIGFLVPEPGLVGEQTVPIFWFFPRLALVADFCDPLRHHRRQHLRMKIWHDLPAATRKYIAEVEQKKA